MKILIAYFSATNNTFKMAKYMNDILLNQKYQVFMLDLSKKENRVKIDLTIYDAVIMGFPVYSVRAPRICREWIKLLDGKNKKCSVFFTYGGFAKDPAHYYIQKLLKKQNFIVVSTAEFLAAHTFNKSGWKALSQRPSNKDYKKAEEYLDKTIKRFLGIDKEILKEFQKPIYSEEQLDQAEKFRFSIITELPNRGNNKCSMCGLCEKKCPTNAMDFKKGFPNRDKCIACFKCIEVCPDNILVTNDISNTWQKKLEMHKITCEDLDKFESKIYL